MVSLKTRIAAQEPLLGTFIKTPHPHVVEVLASSGLDCLCLDAEHAPFDRRDLDLCIMAARANAMPVLVRPAMSAPEQILNALDCGADGILVPHVRSAEEARTVAKAAHYGAGGRGYAGSSRAAGYGRVSIPDHMAASAAGTTVIAQIEDLEALDDIDAIAAVQGIDALFMGRIDLTVALGCTDADDPNVVGALDKIVTAALNAGKPVGMFTPRPTDVALWRDKGVSIFLLGSDHGFMRNGAVELRRQVGF
ncbi:MAG: aldolase [Sphingomonadaceae bacterium]|nr:aldolase [Sphingomonadaceae bacterium]